MQSIFVARPAIIFHSVHHQGGQHNRKGSANGLVCIRYRAGLEGKWIGVPTEPAGGGTRIIKNAEKGKSLDRGRGKIILGLHLSPAFTLKHSYSTHGPKKQKKTSSSQESVPENSEASYSC